MKNSAYIFSKRYQTIWICAALAIGCLFMLAHPAAAESDNANARLIAD
ncbi:hypothetical protein U27_05318 [Candidatus Vecturithrix granuli]|uniref:Uncharacterized protein n=1 Tax=Vecturithrix granuli TaxID=1499967 RepID=A0A081C189_VECG1|nr:hypothetical protein U27_05318 [Candidatus Vecturithrix granuli]